MACEGSCYRLVVCKCRCHTDVVIHAASDDHASADQVDNFPVISVQFRHSRRASAWQPQGPDLHGVKTCAAGCCERRWMSRSKTCHQLFARQHVMWSSAPECICCRHLIAPNIPQALVCARECCKRNVSVAPHRCVVMCHSPCQSNVVSLHANNKFCLRMYVEQPCEHVRVRLFKQMISLHVSCSAQVSFK